MVEDRHLIVEGGLEHDGISFEVGDCCHHLGGGVFCKWIGCLDFEQFCKIGMYPVEVSTCGTIAHFKQPYGC